MSERLASVLSVKGLLIPGYVTATLLFFLLIVLFQAGYYLLVKIQCLVTTMDKKFLLSLLGYGFIPLILGGYLAAHLDVFMSGAGRIVPNIQELLGYHYSYEDIRLISQDSTDVLKIIIVFGGFLASLYATYRGLCRASLNVDLKTTDLIVPFSFLTVLALLFLVMLL